MKLVFLLSCVLLSGISEARVFSFEKENFAPYLKGLYGNKFDNTLVSKSAPVDVEVDANFSNLRGGEFGFAANSSHMGLRFAIEMLIPAQLRDVKGYNQSGVEMFSLDTSLNVVTPKIGLDIYVLNYPTIRYFLFVEGGSSTVSATNSYTLTTEGSAAYSGLMDFSEELKGTATYLSYGAGVEIYSLDTTTFFIEGGFRTLDFDTVNYNKDVTNFSGAKVKGEKALNTDFSARGLTLTGYFASAGFRIYIF